MRKWSVAIIVVGLTALRASAQSIPNGSLYPTVGYDNQLAGSGWKIKYSTGADERFSVDFNGDLAGLTVIGLAMDLWSTGPGGQLGQVAFCTSNLAVDPSGATPDTVGGVISGTVGPTGCVPASSAGFCPAFVAVDLADFTGGSDTHAVMTMKTGDTALWICADTGAVVGRSYFTTNNYSTPALPFTVNWMMRAVVVGSPGTFTINGQTVANVRDDASLSFEFWGTPGTPAYLQGIVAGTAFLPVPGCVLPTGTYDCVPPGIGPDNGGHSGSLAGLCPPVGTSTGFAAFWPDFTSLKPNGHPAIKLTPTATLNISQTSKTCSCDTCWGLADDGVLDSTAWQINNPSTSGDWFSVKFGDPTTCSSSISTLLSLSSACWDFTGTGGTFRSAGVYKANLALDPAGNTLDPASPISAVGGASASVAPGAAQWGYNAATLFNFADVAAPSGTIVLAGLQYDTGITNLWLGSDTDGIDDNFGLDCAVIPSSTSFFTSNNFTSAATPLSLANFMLKLNWN